MPAKNKGTSEKRQEITIAWSSSLPSTATAANNKKEGSVETTDKAESLIEALFSLEEPWRGRFLNLVANLATRWTWDGRRPTQEEIIAWLRADRDLYRGVKLLLDAWPRPRK